MCLLALTNTCFKNESMTVHILFLEYVTWISHGFDITHDLLVRFQRQQPTSGGTVRSSDLQIVVNTSFQTVFSDGFLDPSQFAAAKLTHYSSKQRPSDSSRSWQRILLSGCVHPNPGNYYKVSMSGVCSQCYRSWGELFMQSLLWMGTFEVFWSSKRSRV